MLLYMYIHTCRFLLSLDIADFERSVLDLRMYYFYPVL